MKSLKRRTFELFYCYLKYGKVNSFFRQNKEGSITFVRNISKYWLTLRTNILKQHQINNFQYHRPLDSLKKLMKTIS